MTAWDVPPGHEGVVSLLQADAASGRVAHAYLFSGAGGSMPRRVALAFAAALVCPDGGCGACESCRRVRHRAHPDVELIEPAGMQLLIDQVRDVVRAAWRMPVAGPRRVIVVDGADRMNPNAQNAFLKALEEPPSATVIVLIAPSVEALLETVRSRCREVAFRAPGSAEIVEALVADGVDEVAARRWARAAGSLERAHVLATDPDARRRREELIDRVLRPPSDPGEALERAEWLAEEGKAVREQVAETHEAVAAEHGDWYQETKAAARDRLRREQRRAEQDAVEAALDDVAAALRDILALAADPGAPVLCEERREEIAALASALGPRAPGRVLACLASVEGTRRRLRANANVLLAIEQVFLTLHEQLDPTASRRASV